MWSGWDFSWVMSLIKFSRVEVELFLVADRVQNSNEISSIASDREGEVKFGLSHMGLGFKGSMNIRF
jgi:hypothetical protein